MKISHETPIGLFKKSLEFNDYQYCLVHLLEENREYLEHFEKCRDENIYTLLDNSIFELGEAFEPEHFVQWVRRLKPNEYIIPDALENYPKTVDNIIKWNESYPDLEGIRIGVIQGKTYEQLVHCYQYVDENCDKIAISFDYSYYETIYPHSNKFVSWMNGRIMLIERLLRDKIINTSKPHHLLGCSLPQEFIYYRNYKWIESMDSSNPIVHGLLGDRYESYGLLHKRSIKLCELITHPIQNEEIVSHNIKRFREFVDGKSAQLSFIK